ncbi:MAG: hypothetical protein NVSMB64_25220 [Candidatus Velthaea sp.]
MTSQILAILSVRSDDAGHLTFDVQSLEPNVTFYLPSTSLVVSIWTDSCSAIRARFEHEQSGAITYLQGNESLLSFGRQVGVTVSPSE